jgi:TonB family protein
VASARFATTLAAVPALAIIDRDLGRAAARGSGYSGSLNLTVAGARDLGAAIGCDFYVIGDSQTVRRWPSTGPVYFESYASIFLVSARTGKLISWERPSFEAATAAAAEQLLLGQLAQDETARRYLIAVQRAKEDERHARANALEQNTPIIEEAADENTSDGQSFRPPRPYRRLRPAYPDTAARADAEGTVDVLVDLDKEGQVSRVDVARWAGFGLDEATIDTVRQLHFFPASRDGVATPTRVLLRYNFRRPTKK